MDFLVGMLLGVVFVSPFVITYALVIRWIDRFEPEPWWLILAAFVWGALFATLGGMHIIHINSVGEAALKNGGPYPDGTIFMDDLREFTVSEGTYVEGAQKALVIMTKDKTKYAATGGWGWQAWAGGDPKKPVVTDATKQCFECHQPKKDQDYVYSTYIP